MRFQLTALMPAALLLACCVVVAQEPPPAPGAAAPSFQDASTQQPQTRDDRPLSGMLRGGLGSRHQRHSFFQPTLEFSEGWDSNGDLLNNTQSATSVTGALSVVQLLGRGGSIQYTGSGRYNSREIEFQGKVATAHSLTVAELITRKSWSLMLTDAALYTPTTAYGALQNGNLTGLTFSTYIPGDFGLPALNPLLVPDQSVYTGRSRRVTNTAAAEFEHRVGSRGALTLSGSEGIFRAIDSGLFDATQYQGSIGYNYTLNDRDSVALVYSYEQPFIEQVHVTIRSHSAGMKYRHRMAGRVMLEGGVYAQPYSVSTGAGRTNQNSWAADGNVQYRFAKNQLDLSVARSISLGSGVLAGSRVVSGGGTLSRPLSRNWEFGINATYARNADLSTSFAYESQHVGVSLGRNLLRDLHVFGRYGLQHQSTSGVCTLPVCGLAFRQHVFAVGFGWAHAPIGIW